MRSLFFLCTVLISIGFIQAQTAKPKDAPNADDQYMFYFGKANEDLGKFEFESSIKNCEEALKYKPNDHLVRAMICLDYYEFAQKLDVKKSDEKQWKLDIYTKMVSIAEEGMKAAPDKGECYFMRGLANARMSTTKGILSSLFSAKQIEEDWLIAVSRRSDYVTPNGENLEASANIALGVYYRLCPSFFLFTWTFGISGDLGKAVQYCKKAYELDPTRIEIVKEYGIALITRGLENDNAKDIDAGKILLQKVFTLPHRLRTDQVDVEHSKMLLNDISLCPGYSRDEQQEISEEAYRKGHK
ncbi:MAG: hypothetical protein WCX28_09920 [Bacteriovoracaceae bacterium]